MFHFSPNEAEYFFGRDVFIEELFQATQTRNFIPVLGVSGSGKSSLVLAGLAPKLAKEGNWLFTHFRPGTEPFLALARALVPLYVPNQDETDHMAQARKLAGYFKNRTVLLSDVFATIHSNHPNQRILLIVDQFEELYNPSMDRQICRQFLDTLVNTFQSNSGQSSLSTVLVATMRIDFMGHALSYSPLADVWRKYNVQIRSMNPEELRDVIEKPAQKLGVSFESGLVKCLLKAVDKEPGNLPLLEFALTELWKKNINKQLTHQAYEEIGEVSGALTNYADRKFSEFKLGEQEKVKQIFVQLVRPGRGTNDTRRLATKQELGADKWDLVTKLADQRLVVTGKNASGQETVEVVHEVLIQNWGKLQRWMETDRKFRIWQEWLRVEIYQWKEAKQDEDILLRGQRLDIAKDWLQKRSSEIGKNEKDFIKHSVYFRNKELKLENEHKKKEERILAKDQEIKLLYEQTEFYNEQIEYIRKDNTRLIEIIETMVDKQTTKYDQYNANFNVGNYVGCSYVEIDESVSSQQSYANQNNYEKADKNLAEAAAKIKQIINQLSQTNPISTEIEKLTVVARAAEEIKNNPTLKAKVINAPAFR
ncbi:MAG: hypothetical protein F6K49_34175, partial [Moorea sp. SIO3I6]|nr:hypothetical protein [Moorena sp. SIO3I6]